MRKITIILCAIFATMLGYAHGNEVLVKPKNKKEITRTKTMSEDDISYCTPTYSFSCSTNTQRISNITLSGESITLNNESECSDNSYGDYTDLTPADLVSGETYALSVSTDASSSTGLLQVRAWIDYNQDGEFSDDEEIANTEGDGLPNGTKSFNFTVPEDTGLGNYRMRVRMVYGGSADFAPCGNATFGEAEDYNIEVVQLDSCEGTPTAGTINEEDFNVCPGTLFNLSVSGASDPANGLERIWQSSPTGEDEWTNIEGANTNAYTAEEGIYESTDFRFKLTCTVSEETSISDIISVNVDMNADCYCIPSSGCTDGDRISNVSLIGESVTLDNDTECSEGGYGDYTDLNTPDLVIGETYVLSVSTDYAIFGDEQVRVWIDYNHDGQFSEEEEIANTDGNGLPDGTETFNFTIPENNELGDYRMRVRLGYSQSAPTFNACDNVAYGETEDYTINIIEEAPVETCPSPTDVDVTDITDTTANVSWTAEGDENQWEVVYGEEGFDPNEGEGTTIEIENQDPQATLNDLNPDATYDVYVKAICAEEDESDWSIVNTFTTKPTPPVNNYLCDALELEVGAICTETYTNIDAFAELDEPIGSCLNNFHGTNSVWFTFTAPENGDVIITSDFESTSFNTQMMVYDAPENCDDLQTLGEEIGCANNGEDLELEDLIPGEIYYIKVAGFNNEAGEFCLEITTDMSVDSQVFDNFTFYPNPVKDQLTLKAGSQIESVEVYNLLGQNVISAQPNSLEAQINTEALQSGVYLMEVNINGSQKSFRVVKQ